MLSIELVLAAAAVMAFSGLPACLFPRRSAAGQWLTTSLMLLGGLLGLAGLALWFGQPPTSLRWQWFLPWGQFAVTIDDISVVFLAPIFVVPALGSIYGLGYWKQSEHQDNGCRLGISYGSLAGSMVLVTVARDGVLFLIAWEVMALAAYFAATVEEDNPDVCRAGWVYLIATHVGTLCLIAMFAMWRHTTGSFGMEPASVNLAISAEAAGTIFVLAVIGFGFKAGLMPLHVWLPGAHANAPSHVSAVMSGVMLKMGIYGIVRMTALFLAPALWWGGALLFIGALTGVAGMAFAIGQHDLKRLLAYSSIENIGVIAMGLGLALLGRSLNQPDWVVLGLGAALLHVWNHSLFKSLLFFNAGAIIHATHTRDINQLGGLGNQMPRSMALFIVGAVAICALPPLNGFASEWLLYVGLFRTLGVGNAAGFPVAAVAAVALAMIGTLAVACFVKVLSAVFLGSSRSDATAHAHDPPPSMNVPMVVLAAGCACLGLFPLMAIPLLDKAARTWAALPEQAVSIAAVAPLPWITAMALILVLLVTAIVLFMRTLPRAGAVSQANTWACGYALPTTRMQYTGSSFGQMLVNLFAVIIWPKNYWPTISGIFPKAAHFKSIVPDAVLDHVVLPLFRVAGRYLPRLHVLQQGQSQMYVLYVLIIVIVLLFWGAMGGQP